jgi:head-tail adaptor
MPGVVYPLARDLRSRIAVQRRAATQNAGGGQAGDWATYIASRQAKLTPFSPRRGNAEEVIASLLQGTTIYECWVRYDGLTSTILYADRVVDLRGGLDSSGDYARAFNVRWAEDIDQRRRWILLQLERGAAPG